MLPQATADFYRAQQRQAVATMALTRREWARMGADFDRSWTTVGPRLVLLLGSAQLGAARNGVAYIPRVLAETGQSDDHDGLVNASAFPGYAADGRTLDGLLYGAVTQAKTAVGQGAPTLDALASGGTWLDRAVHTAVADAGRISSGVGIAARRRVGGWVRMLNPPSCGRCAVLAGKWFRWNQGFRRHPRCDCVHIPSSENIAGDFRTDPQAAVAAGHVTGLSVAQKKAIADGADLGQVVNASRGMSTTVLHGQKVQVTREGTTARGLAGQRLDRAAQRLTPESIYQVADDRDEAIRLLRRNGYLL